MDILEQRDEWYEQFKSSWLANFEETGSIDWSLYSGAKNKEQIAGEPIDLSKSRLLLVSSAGAYTPATQSPFDAENDLGAYDIRVFPSDTPFDAIDYAHTHYSHDARKADPQVLMPLGHLAAMVANGEIGSLADNVVSFMGYQPDIVRVAEETTPAIIEAAKAEKADGVLLVPA